MEKHEREQHFQHGHFMITDFVLERQSMDTNVVTPTVFEQTDGANMCIYV